jgi:hypothetical protein
MGYFVRRYIPGVKNSGTKDILRSDEPISTADFVSFAHKTGHGKYVLGVRGNGIRGWKKLTDCIVEPSAESSELVQVFAAESISVRKNMKVDELSDSELMDLLYSMSRTTPKPEDMETFQKDLGKIHSELSKRGSSGSSGTSAAETATVGSKPIASAGFAVGSKSAAAMGLMAGLVIGALGTSWYYKSQIDELKSTIERFDKKLSEAEDYMKKSEAREAKKEAAAKAAESYDAMSGLNNFLLGDFNRRNGPKFN